LAALTFHLKITKRSRGDANYYKSILLRSKKTNTTNKKTLRSTDKIKMCRGKPIGTNVEKPLPLRASPYSGQRWMPARNWSATSTATTAIQFHGSSCAPPSKRKFLMDILDRAFEILDEETDTTE
jgi:hypothetical protein